MQIMSQQSMFGDAKSCAITHAHYAAQCAFLTTTGVGQGFATQDN